METAVTGEIYHDSALRKFLKEDSRSEDSARSTGRDTQDMQSESIDM